MIGKKIEKTFLCLLAAAILLSLTSIGVFGQLQQVVWRGDTDTSKTKRDARMKFRLDARGLKTFSFDTSFYFRDTKNYHECTIYFTRNDKTSKWSKIGNTTKIIDEYGNQTLFIKTARGFNVSSGCRNTAFYKVAFRKIGGRYIGKRIN